MKIQKHLLFVLLSLFCASGPFAQTSHPLNKDLAWIVQDKDSKQVLSQNQEQKQFNPQEAVRLMTFYTALKEAAGKSDDQLKAPDDALQNQPSLQEKGRVLVGVDPKENQGLEELLRLTATLGADDAALLLAIKVSGTVPAFVQAMNRTAQELKMGQSLFTAPIASPDQKTSAGDLALLIKALREEFPEESAYFAEEDFAFNGKTMKNPLTVINPDDKSFHPVALSSCCLVAGLWQRGQDKDLADREMIFVFHDIGEKGKNLAQSSKILTSCQADYESIELFEAGDVIGKIPVKEGQQPYVNVAASSSVRVTLARKDIIEKGIQGIKMEIEHNPEIAAPIRKGMRVGALNIYLDDKLIATYDAVTAEDVNRQNFFERVLPKKHN